MSPVILEVGIPGRLDLLETGLAGIFAGLGESEGGGKALGTWDRVRGGLGGSEARRLSPQLAN